ncbi:hypothetical protein RHOSPDRAFT_36339 [Rhodotorula sp. JG-1b]|nr:hypothetical protein RHOSPDRAFT_36339 [Rhodotorula sp. JG-1b]
MPEAEQSSPAPLLNALPALPGAPPPPPAGGRGGAGLATPSPAPATPASSTSTTTAATARGAKGKGAAARKADDAPEGEPKPKKKRTATKKSSEPGPGKHWRKGLKGNLAGVGLDPAIAATLQAGGASGAGTPTSSAAQHASSPGPSRGSTVGVSSAIAPPPKLGNQFITVQSLQIGTPRPRKWIKSKMAFKKVGGGTIMLPSWQGDSYSAFATAVGTAEIDELASPPPSAPSNLAAATAAFAHPTRPSLVDTPPPPHATTSSGSSSTIVVPKLEPNLNPPVLPPLPPLGAASVPPPLGQPAPPTHSTREEGGVAADQAGAEGSRVEGAPADPERKMEVDADAARLTAGASATPAGESAPSGESTEKGVSAV